MFAILWTFAPLLFMCSMVGVTDQAGIPYSPIVMNNLNTVTHDHSYEYKLAMDMIAQYRTRTYPTNLKSKWLFLTSYSAYRTAMDRHYYLQYYAARRHPNINATLWGYGFPGYQASSSVVDNIKSRYGSPSHFDVIYVTGGGYSDSELRAASQHSPIMNREHECWGYRCLPDFIDCNVSIVLLTFAYEIDLYHLPFSYNRVISHSPTSAEPLIFYPTASTKANSSFVRDIDVLVVGARNAFVYPIRTRIGEMIRKGVIKKSYLHEHPGYYFENNTLEQTETQLHTYAALLRRAKIVIVDASRYGYALSKYAEVSLSGALAMGDIPAEREDEFRSFMVEISMDMTDAQIVSAINYWTTHDEERQAKATLGQQIMLNGYTFDHSIDRSLQAVLRYRRKEYGIIHNYPYTLKCFPLDNSLIEKPTANNWCGSGGGRHDFPRSLCKCSKSKVNYFDNELDLDDWKGRGVDVNATDPQMHLIPTAFLTGCYPRKQVIDFVSRSPAASHCECEHPTGDWHEDKSCYVSSSALTISRYLAHFDVRKSK